MKSLKLLFTLCFILILPSNAKNVAGIIITDKDTLSVTFDIPMLIGKRLNFPKIQENLYYFTNNGMRTNIFPETTQEIQFYHKNKKHFFEYHPLQTFTDSQFRKKKNIFIERIIDGTLKMYTYYSLEIGGYMHNGTFMPDKEYQKHCYVQKDNSQFEEFHYGNFNTCLLLFVKDCPAIASKLEQKLFVYNFSNIKMIFNYYNTKCNS